MFDKIQIILMMKTNLAIELLFHTIAIKLIAKTLNISALNLNLKLRCTGTHLQLILYVIL